MGSFTDSFSDFKQLTKHFPLEHRPRMLKDFLFDHDPNSYSSTIPTIIHNHLNTEKLLKSRPTALAAFQAMINKAVKNFHFTPIKSPSSILPRSLSRRLSRSSRSACRRETEIENKQSQIKITVTIKDIIRWKSFRDLVEEKSPLSDFASSPHHCTTTSTTARTPYSSSSSSSNGSSWCDSDFTIEYGNFAEYGENDYGVVVKEHSQSVGEEDDSVKQTSKSVGIKAAENQQNSPVEEDEKLRSFLDGCEGTEEVEEKACQLLNLVREKNSSDGDCKVVLDFFGYELKRNDGFVGEILSREEAWIDGEQGVWIEWDKEGYVREMEREGKWSKSKFEEEEEVALAIENGMVDELVVELLYGLAHL